MSLDELCVFVTGGQRGFAWEGPIQQTWATNRTIFADWPWSTEHLDCKNCTRAPLRLQLDPAPGIGPDHAYFQAMSLWSTIGRRLEDSNQSSTWLNSCYWLMHVDGRSYINIKRVAQRLSCVKGLYPEYYGLSPMTGESRVPLADESSGYVISRKLLLSLLSSGWLAKCADYFLTSSDAHGFGWSWPSGFYTSLCLWHQQRLMLQRLGDPEQEVLMRALTKEQGNSPLHRLRKLHPSGHCILLVAAKTPANLHEIHRRVRLVSPLEDPARDTIRNEVGCFTQSLLEPLALAPPWSFRVARSISRCPLKLAVSQTELGLSVLKRELLQPSRPRGPAVQKLQAARGRKQLCILMPTTDATRKQVDRAVSAVTTWAKPYLPLKPDLHDTMPALALLYGRPLFSDWAPATLSLRGDLDVRHPKFNALRFIYMWLTLAMYHSSDPWQQINAQEIARHQAWEDCKFFMKADMDAYVHVPRILKTLRELNASTKIYAGQVTLSHGPGYKKWKEFAHGLGYILSGPALRSAIPGLQHCMKQLLDARMEAIEDMLLAACLRHSHIFPVQLGPIIYDFKLSSEHIDRVVQEALVTHRVEEEEMYLLHDAVTK